MLRCEHSDSTRGRRSTRHNQSSKYCRVVLLVRIANLSCREGCVEARFGGDVDALNLLASNT